MKKIGLLGGVSWASTLDYYRYINKGINERLGGLNFAECIICSLNFNDVQRQGWDNWGETFRLFSDAGRRLKDAGAEAIVLCANTAQGVLASEFSHVRVRGLALFFGGASISLLTLILRSETRGGGERAYVDLTTGTRAWLS